MLRGHDDVTSGLQDFTMRERRSKRRRSGRRDGAFGMMLSSTTDDFSVDGDFLPTAGTSRLQNHGAQADTSPDSKCPICLDKFDNVAHLNQCLHRFCFKCIKEWAKNKAVCPLCKQPFNSIFHTIQAEDDFQEYVLRPAFDGSLAEPGFRYRTTRTRENQLRSAQRTYSAADNGISFEGFSSRHSQQRGSDIHRMLRRPASRHPASAEGHAMRPIQEQGLFNYRRARCQSGIRVGNVQGGGRYRDVSAEFFRRNPACLQRLVPWLKRELTMLFGTHDSLVNTVQHIVMSNVTRYDMESPAFAEDLQPFLRHRTHCFIHKFINFARCPYNIEAYDHHASYDCPAPSYEGRRSESSVLAKSPEEASSREPGGPSSSLTLESAPWDDESPGTSYSTVEQATTSMLNTVDRSYEEPSSSRITSTDIKTEPTEGLQDNDLPSDDCVIVGFVKPLAERTPELVELSSDSEASLCEVAIEQTKKSQLKPFMLHGSRSSSLSSSDLSNESIPANKPKLDTSHGKKHSKRHNEQRPKGASSKSMHKSRNDGAHWRNKEKPRHRAQSQNSDCSSHNRAYERRSRRHSKRRLIDKSLEKYRHKNCGGKRPRSRDPRLSWQSQTVSLTSESSRERGGTSSRSRNHSGDRSPSHYSDNYFPADNYQRNSQFECTYSQNSHRDGYEQYSRTRACSRGHYSRLCDSPEYDIKSYSEMRETKRQRGFATGKAHPQYRSRSRSHSRMRKHHNPCDKPSGKRKYKTRHLETGRKKENGPQVEGVRVKEKCMQPGVTSTDTSSGGHKDDVNDTSDEPKCKRRKNTSRLLERITLVFLL